MLRAPSRVLVFADRATHYMQRRLNLDETYDDGHSDALIKRKQTSEKALSDKLPVQDLLKVPETPSFDSIAAEWRPKN